MRRHPSLQSTALAAARMTMFPIAHLGTSLAKGLPLVHDRRHRTSIRPAIHSSKVILALLETSRHTHLAQQSGVSLEEDESGKHQSTRLAREVSRIWERLPEALRLIEVLGALAAHQAHQQGCRFLSHPWAEVIEPTDLQ